MALEKEILEVEEEKESREMNGAEFAIYTDLTEVRASASSHEEQAEDIARDVVAEFEDRVDTNYEGWKTNEKTIQEIELIMLDVLLKEYSMDDLVTDDFIDAVRGYLLENYA